MSSDFAVVEEMLGAGSTRTAPSRFSGAQSMVETSALSAGFVERLQNYESAVEVLSLSPLEAVADEIYVSRWMKLVAGDERLEIREVSIHGFVRDKPMPGALVETINLSSIDKLKTQVNENDEREFQLELIAGKSALVRHGTVRDLHNVRNHSTSSEGGRQGGGGTSPRRNHDASGRSSGRILRIRAPSKLVVDHWKFSIMTAIVTSAKRKADEHAAAQAAATGVGALTSAGSGTNLAAYANSNAALSGPQHRLGATQAVPSGRQGSSRGVVVGSLQPGLGLGPGSGSLVAQHHLLRMHSGGSAGHGLNALAALPDSDAVSQSSSDRGALSGFPEEGSEGEESPVPVGAGAGARGGGQARGRGGVAASPGSRRGLGTPSTAQSPGSGREAPGFPLSTTSAPSLHACSSAPSGLAAGPQPLPQAQAGGGRLQGRGSLQEETGSEDSSEDEELLALVQARKHRREQGGESEEEEDDILLGARVGTMSPNAAQAKMKQQEAAQALCVEAASQGRVAGRRNSVDAARAVPPLSVQHSASASIEGVGAAALEPRGQETSTMGVVGSASAGGAAAGVLSAAGSGGSGATGSSGAGGGGGGGAWKPRFMRHGPVQPTPIASSDNSPVPSVGGDSDTASPAVRPSAAELSGGARPPGYPSRSQWTGEGDAQYGVWAAQGHRAAMEDVYSVVQNLQPAPSQGHSSSSGSDSPLATRYYGLFDGHYTGYTAQVAGQRLHAFLAAHPTFTAEPGMTASGSSKAEACSRAGPGLRPVFQSEDVRGLAAAVHASFFRVEESLLEDIASGRTGQRQLPGESRPKLDQESGTTALVCCLRGSQLVVGFAGDCRAVLATLAHPDKVGRLSTKERVYHAVELTHDHSAVSEKVRIEAAGASVHSEVEVKMSRLRDIPRQSPDLLDDPWVKELLEHPSKGDRVTSRVYDIGVSRSIGDLAYKGEGMRSNLDFGDKRLAFKADLVLTSPEVVVREVPRTATGVGPGSGPGAAPSAFLLLACDGLWEVMGSEEACERVGKYMWERAMDRGRGALAGAAYTATGDPLGPEGDCMVAARRLVHMAFRLGSQDNITALVVRL